MANYPSSIYSPRDKENRSGVVYDATKKTVIFAEDIEKLDDEVVAVETYVGPNEDGQSAPVDGKVLTGKAGGKSKWADPSGGGFSSKARAYLSGTAQVIPNATTTKVQLNTESYDGLGEFDPTTNYRFTAQAAGYYLITAQADWLAAVDQCALYVSIHKNGAVDTAHFRRASGTGEQAVSISDIVYLAANDYIELYVYQNSGGNLSLDAYPYSTWISIHRIS